MRNVRETAVIYIYKAVFTAVTALPRSLTSPISNAGRRGAVAIHLLLVGGAYLGERVRIYYQNCEIGLRGVVFNKLVVV